MMQVLLIENDSTHLLYPFCETHCSWELRAGMYTIIERWSRSSAQVCTYSQRALHHRSFVERYTQFSTEFQANVPTIVIGGHAAASTNAIDELVRACSTSTTAKMIMNPQGDVVGSYVPTGFDSIDAIADVLNAIDATALESVQFKCQTITYLWDLFDLTAHAVEWDSSDEYMNYDFPNVVIDTSNGPVLIGQGVNIEPFSVIKGPVAIGSNVVIKAQSRLESCSIGPSCKVSGEIQNTIMHGYSNKQHYGYLGHTFVGEWVNLAAGTTTSNLKTNYNSIRVSLPHGNVSTQRMFLGSLIGDHVKTAIGTLLNVGTVVGPFTVIHAGHNPPALVEPFTWIDQEYDTNKAIHTAAQVMMRRSVDLGHATASLYKSVAPERK